MISVIVPSSFLSARSNLFSSRLFGVASGGGALTYDGPVELWLGIGAAALIGGAVVVRIVRDGRAAGTRAAQGTLRYLLAAPVPRAGLLLVKFAVTVVFCAADANGQMGIFTTLGGSLSVVADITTRSQNRHAQWLRAVPTAGSEAGVRPDRSVSQWGA